MEQSYWIRGDEVYEVETTHIGMIMRSPDLFGLTLEEIREKHKAYGERMGREGKAREEIIRQVSEKGWIRVRKYVGRGAEYWSIQCDKYPLRKRAITNFLEYGMYGKGFINRYDEVRILAYSNGFMLKEEAKKLIDKLKNISSQRFVDKYGNKGVKLIFGELKDTKVVGVERRVAGYTAILLRRILGK